MGGEGGLTNVRVSSVPIDKGEKIDVKLTSRDIYILREILAYIGTV